MTLEINQLSKNIGQRQVLDQISFKVEPGELIGLIGRNGVGKTTLFRTINRQYQASGGEILIDGQSILRQPKLRTQLSFVDAQANFFSSYTPQQIADFYQLSYPDFDDEKFHQLMTKYHLDLQTKVRRFSKGMTGLFIIILSVCTQATYLFLDEPLDGLDMLVRKNVLNILIDEVATGQRAILISSHNLGELEGIIDRALMLKGSHLIHDYQLEEMRSSARKLQLVYPTKEIPAILKEQGHIISIQGRVIVVVFEKYTDELKAAVAATEPVFQEELPLGLSDLFMANLTDEQDFTILS